MKNLLLFLVAATMLLGCMMKEKKHDRKQGALRIH